MAPTAEKKKNYYVTVTGLQLKEKIYLVFSDCQSIANRAFVEFMLGEELALSVIKNYDSTNKRAGSFLNAYDDAQKRFDTVHNYLLENQKNSAGEHFTYENSPFIKELKARWEEHIRFSEFSPEKKEEFKEALEEIIAPFSHNDPLSVYNRLSKEIDRENYGYVLASLSVIASTLFYWPTKNTPSPNNHSWLYDMALPPLPSSEGSLDLQLARDKVVKAKCSIAELMSTLKKPLNDSDEKGEANFLISQRYRQLGDTLNSEKYLNIASRYYYAPAVSLKNERAADKYLEDICGLIENSENISNYDVKNICMKCEQILQLSPIVSDSKRGKAAIILYKYINNGQYTSSSGESADKYLELSNNCGNPDAAEIWKIHNPFSITPQFDRAYSDDEGMVLTNCSNHISDVFKKTKPTTWEMMPISTDGTNLSSLVQMHASKRILLVSDDFKKNLRDALDVLQTIKTLGTDGILEPPEIYIRSDSENASSIIDTALSHMPEYHIPVYILDDDKMAAQQLLSKHPLFYPLKHIKLGQYANASTADKPTLHFVILGSTRTAEWLVREAFWMMGFRDNSVNSRITVFAPDGETFVQGIKSRFPGMASDRVKISDMAFPEIDGHNEPNLNSHTMFSSIQKLVANPNTYFYFAVSTECDEENLSLAKRLREILVRNQIYTKSDKSFESVIPIAFHCRDEYIASISRRLVVETEDFGHKWFNTWALIPFGDWSQNYNWDNINSGTFERLAKCIHLQYSGISPDDSRNNTEKAQAAVHEYFRRQYNRDSSYSLALSMPYRLFQFNDTFSNIYPLAWNILDSTAYATVEQLEQLSRRLRKSLSSTINNDINVIAKWEHDRWVRWMLSRGWLPISPEESVFAFKCGNIRQQLFVARLHPCICSYDSLKELSEKLTEKCNIKKDFYYSNIRNIECTEALLRLEWIENPKKESHNDRF